MTLLLNTIAVPPRDRLAYWTDMICNTYVQLECEAIRSDRFAGSIKSQSMPGLDLSMVASGAQKVLRTPQQIARANDDYFLVSIQTRGNGVLRQDGRDALLSPGDFALYDSTRAYELQFEGDFQQIVLKLPGEQLRNAVRDTEKLTATTVCGRAGAGHLMIGMIKTLWDDVDALESASAVAVASGVLNILVAGLQTLPASKRRSVSSLTSYHLTRVKGEIDSRLRDPGLVMGDVARDLGISVGHIHRCSGKRRPRPRNTSGRVDSTCAAATWWMRDEQDTRSAKSPSAGASTTRLTSAGHFVNASVCRHVSGDTAPCTSNVSAASRPS